jgi:outer membrane autotransporter protein
MTGVCDLSAGGGQINIDLDSVSGAFGNIAATGIATIPGTVGVDVNVLGTGYIADGTTYDIVTGGAGGTVAGGNTVTDNNSYVSFTTTGGDNLILVASRSGTSFDNFTTTGNATAVAEALEAAGKAGATGDMKTVLDTLESLPTGGIEGALSTMVPDMSSGAMNASREVTGQFLGSISNRLGYRRSGLSGVATGDMFQGTGVWIQSLGSHIQQDERKGIQGYQANVFGTSVGVDQLIDRNYRVGAAFGYGLADVNSKAAGRPQTNVDSFNVALYGSYDSFDLCESRKQRLETKDKEKLLDRDGAWYVDGMLGFTQNNYDSKREIWLTPADMRTAKADHHGQQYSTKVETGYTFMFEDTADLEVTPFASLGYNYLRMNDYKEKGADALNLNVDGQGYHELLQTLGMKFAYPMVSKKMGTFVPSVKAGWTFDYIADRFESTSSFAGGGPSFETRGAKPARNGFLLGGELSFLTKGNWTFTGNWDLELKDQYASNTYYGTVRYDF